MNKLEIVDENTIMEISTFVSKGQSFETSDGNHDDLMMNLVMFGYFVGTQSFGDMTDVNLKQMLFDQRMREIEDDVPPFGIIDDGNPHIPVGDGRRSHTVWVGPVMTLKNGKYSFIINRYIEIIIPYYDNLLYLNKRKLLWIS